MKLTGEFTFNAPREKVWQALNDISTLQKHMPGCESLEQVGPDEYKALLKIGVAAIKGTYNATLGIRDRVAPERYTLTVEGKGAPGFVKGEGQVTLIEQGDKTVLRYAGDLQVGGLIARVGQRLIAGVTESMTRQFFEGLGREAES